MVPLLALHIKRMTKICWFQYDAISNKAKTKMKINNHEKKNDGKPNEIINTKYSEYLAVIMVYTIIYDTTSVVRRLTCYKLVVCNQGAGHRSLQRVQDDE